MEQDYSDTEPPAEPPTKKPNAKNTYRKGNGAGRGRGRGRGSGTPWKGLTLKTSKPKRMGAVRVNAAAERDENVPNTLSDKKRQQADFENTMDTKFGFRQLGEEDDKTTRLAWLINMHPTTVEDTETGIAKSAVDLYFISSEPDANGSTTFKVSVPAEPYFFLEVKMAFYEDVDGYLKNKYAQHIYKTELVEKEDLSLKNHLSGLKRSFMKVIFRTVQSLLAVRNDLLPKITRNKNRRGILEVYSDWHLADEGSSTTSTTATQDWSECILDIREYDVTYYQRVAIDKELRVGHWYEISVLRSDRDTGPSPTDTKAIDGYHGNGYAIRLREREDLREWERPEMRICAYDIETTKQPLKMPDPAIDQIMMISYMIDGQGFLVVNRQIVSADIEPFEYTPKPEYRGPFMVFNEKDELATLRRFFGHLQTAKPAIYVTFNGDYFDWPFVEARARANGLELFTEIGVRKTADFYTSRYGTHLDCFYWVKRDSYLPQGSQGLKAVTKAKLGYDPVELDPELILPYAVEQPARLASYSVSDAVATYYLYLTYVHPFIFSLCTIIPMNPDDVLRKGSGTLCEALLMAEAYRAGVIFPNKSTGSGDVGTRRHRGRPVESETYIGGHVEALEAGVFRNDLRVCFDLNADLLRRLRADVDAVVQFAVENEAKLDVGDITEESLQEVTDKIKRSLSELEATPKREELPKIYHLDVAAMYPNIILTNRLQPAAVVDKETCAACDFNTPENRCKRYLHWMWRGDVIPVSSGEFELVRSQLEMEKFRKDDPAKPEPAADAAEYVTFSELPRDKQQALLVKRLKDYAYKTKHKRHEIVEEERESCVCMRENPFYVDTVRAFRDRRYEYKDKLKKAQKDKAAREREIEQSTSGGDDVVVDTSELERAKNMVVLYDSLQLAHKCILNSFYGYVMRRGARWYSMEMAGMVTYTGAKIITQTREIIEGVGKPLELDTDGIWCVLPATFPQNFELKIKPEAASRVGRNSFAFSYPCSLLNYNVARNFTNDQYQDRDSVTGKYRIRSECTIFFEVDGPYRAMILPAAKEEDKKIKKRYAVFHLNGTLAELKGFEVKRRGELKLIKQFQSVVFEKFLEGRTLEECYAAVGAVANAYFDILHTQGAANADDELLELLSESRNMTKRLAEYGGQKSSALTTAKRLQTLLNVDIDGGGRAGLSCKFVISKLPAGRPITERAIPVAIFAERDEAKRNYFLQKWTGAAQPLRQLLDWEYYKGRLASAVQKIVTIPAAMQNVANPVPRVAHPDWLVRRLRARETSHQQQEISGFFAKLPSVGDIEDMAIVAKAGSAPRRVDVTAVVRRTHKRGRDADNESAAADGGSETSTAAADTVDGVDNAPPPSPNSDYAGWLAHQKAKWKLQREQKKRRRLEWGEPTVAPSLNRYADRGTAAGRRRPAHGAAVSDHELRRRPWDVIEISETEVDGEFRAWVLLAHGGMLAVRLIVPRVFYVNTAATMAEAADGPMRVRKVTRYLPRSRPSLNLYEVAIPEEKFLECSRELSNTFTHPDVEGVYETRTPLLFKAITELGATCRVRPSAVATAAAKDHFMLDELEGYQPPAGRMYLEHAAFRRVFVFHSFRQRNTGSVAILGIFPPQPPYRVWVVSPSAGDTSAAATDGITEPLPREMRNNSDYVVTMAKSLPIAYRQATKALRDEHGRGPTVIVTQCTLAPAAFARAVPALREFPRVNIPGNQRDNEYEAFGWSMRASLTMLKRFEESKEWFAYMLQFARYANVPIGNLDADYALSIADVSFARLLRKHNQLLWASPTSRPDLGGSEDDDNLLCAGDELRPPVLCEPGCYYDTVCVEIELHELAIDTVLEAHHVHDLEGGGGLGISVKDVGAPPNAGALDAAAVGDPISLNRDKTDDELDASASARAFRTLKELVTHWSLGCADKDDAKRQCAETLISHFYRWLGSPQAKLHEPALHRLVHDLMKKVWSQLIGLLRRLGSKIVFANFNRIVLCTNKKTREEALHYVEYVIETIKEQEPGLFAWIDFSLKDGGTGVWDTLLWMDEANYGGIPATSRATDDDGDIVEVDEDKENSQNDGNGTNSQLALSRSGGKTPVRVISHWNISEFLPKQIQTHFQVVISKFLLSLNTPAGKAAGRDKALIGLTQDLMKLAEEIKTHCVRAEFPDLPGSHLEMTDPAFEFVKMVCHVLGLGSQTPAVHTLKKSLMRLLGENEFSQKAEFVNPCLSYTLPDVICSFCHSCRDIDLLRDPHLVGELVGDEQSASGKRRTLEERWTCSECNHPYDRALIERTLVELLQRRSVGYQVQDLLCSRCRQVKMENMIEVCAQCSGRFVCRESEEDFTKKARVFANIAKYHEFAYLKEIAEWILQTR